MRGWGGGTGKDLENSGGWEWGVEYSNRVYLVKGEWCDLAGRRVV